MDRHSSLPRSKQKSPSPKPEISLLGLGGKGAQHKRHKDTPILKVGEFPELKPLDEYEKPIYGGAELYKFPKGPDIKGNNNKETIMHKIVYKDLERLKKASPCSSGVVTPIGKRSGNTSQV